VLVFKIKCVLRFYLRFQLGINYGFNNVKSTFIEGMMCIEKLESSF